MTSQCVMATLDPDLAQPDGRFPMPSFPIGTSHSFSYGDTEVSVRTAESHWRRQRRETMRAVGLFTHRGLGPAASHRSLHSFPPPPSQLTPITPAMHESGVPRSLAQRLQEQVESWFGTERGHGGVGVYYSVMLPFHSRFCGTV